MKSTIKSYDLVEALAAGSNPASLRDDLTRLLRALVGQLKLWHMRAQTRRELCWMSESQLDDLGITRIDAYQEANKPFWKP